MADKLIRVNSRVSVMASQVAYVIAPEFKDRIDVHLLDGRVEELEYSMRCLLSTSDAADEKTGTNPPRPPPTKTKKNQHKTHQTKKKHTPQQPKYPPQHKNTTKNTTTLQQ